MRLQRVGRASKNIRIIGCLCHAARAHTSDCNVLHFDSAFGIVTERSGRARSPLTPAGLVCGRLSVCVGRIGNGAHW